MKIEHFEISGASLQPVSVAVVLVVLLVFAAIFTSLARSC